MKRLGVAWRVLRAEGLLAVRDRTLDRIAEARRRRSFSPAPPGWRPPVPIPVLHLSATPPALRLGGMASQLLRRIESEPEPLALLHPEPRGWRLEVNVKGERRSLRFPGSPPLPIALLDAAFEQAVRSAAEMLGVRALHVEGLHGLPPASLLRLGRAGLDLSLSLHDFAAFCPRPHLLERPQLQFCGYSRDFARCGRCLRQDWQVEDVFQKERREIQAELLASARALVFPSDFLRRAYAEIFPGLSPERQRVEIPGRKEIGEPPARRSRALRHVALVGGVQAHKGALVFERVVQQMARERLRWTVYGGGDAELLARLRRLPQVRIRGYYRHSTLPRLLRSDGVDLALLLSIVPESYSLVLDECAAAGVPVIAFDLGAAGDRLPRLGAGELVSLGAGAEGIVRVLRRYFRG